MLALKQRFTIILANALKHGVDEEPDEADVAKGLARMFAELAEAYCNLISTGAPLRCRRLGMGAAGHGCC